MSLHVRTSDASGGPPVTRTFRLTVAILAGLASLMLLSGCTWFAPDAGMGAVTTIAQQELNKDAAAIRSPEEGEAAGARVRRLLGRPLTADAAVQIALLNNRGLQAAYDELAIADAEQVGAGAEMGAMEMPLPENTLPMMTGSVSSGRSRWAACSRS